MLFKKTTVSRKVFGFLCSPELINLIKDLAALLQIPIYCVTEHCLQIGAISIGAACRHTETEDELKDHLTREHLLKQVLTLNTDYDVGVAQQALKQEMARIRQDKLVRELVSVLQEENLSPRLLVEVTKELLHDARRRRSQNDYREEEAQEW